MSSENLTSKGKTDLGSQSGASAEDRISGLPNTVLCHILSFIPSTKDVMKTGVLSTRWKDILVHVPDLYFNDDEFSSSDDFAAFVDHALRVRNSSAIQRLHLHFNGANAQDFYQVNHWLSIVVRCNVVELDLSFGGTDTMFEMPISILTCKTLKVLSLRPMIIVNMPKSECSYFPKLELLHIHFKVINLFRELYMDLFHLPALEHLSIDGNLGLNILNVSISAPELKTFTVNLYGLCNMHDYCNFSIHAPKLGKLDLTEGSLSKVYFKNVNSLVEANVHFHNHYGEDFYLRQDYINRETEFLAEISKVKYLSLSTTIAQACSFPAFANLTKFKLVHNGGPQWFMMLMNVLKRSPSLECMKIEDHSDRTHGTIEVIEPYVFRITAEERNQMIELPIERNAVVFDLIKNIAGKLNWTPPECIVTPEDSILRDSRYMKVTGILSDGIDQVVVKG